MLTLSIAFDAKGFERALLKAVGDEARKIAVAKALTRVAAGARSDVMGRIEAIFDHPTPFTKAAVRYRPATPENLEATVYISEDATRGLSPRKYLRAEIEGGRRNDKRSEVSLKGRELLGTGQQTTPGEGVHLDSYGNIPGSAIVQILSRVGGFGEQGYRANATAATRKRLIKQGVAVTSRGFEFFVKRGKNGQPVGIWQVTSAGTKATPGVRGSSVRGSVKPILAFVNRRPNYRPRFAFSQLVLDYAAKHRADEILRALREGIK